MIGVEVDLSQESGLYSAVDRAKLEKFTEKKNLFRGLEKLWQKTLM